MKNKLKWDDLLVNHNIPNLLLNILMLLNKIVHYCNE